MSSKRGSVWPASGALFFFFIIMLVIARHPGNRQPSAPGSAAGITPVSNPIEDVLGTSSTDERKEGVAAAILIDTSGSMKESVNDANGNQLPKLVIARRSALDFVTQFEKYAREHANQTVQLGIYEFSNRRQEPPYRTLVPIGPPNVEASRTALERMVADGDTPIGDAMIAAKRDLDKSGLSKRHILVLTDGENNHGYSPVDVTRAILNSKSENDRASIYFVAFDVAASKFAAVKDSGGLVLAASNETDLKSTLDYLLTGKILAEQPDQPR